MSSAVSLRLTHLRYATCGLRIHTPSPAAGKVMTHQLRSIWRYKLLEGNIVSAVSIRREPKCLQPFNAHAQSVAMGRHARMKQSTKPSRCSTPAESLSSTHALPQHASILELKEALEPKEGELPHLLAKNANPLHRNRALHGQLQDIVSCLIQPCCYGKGPDGWPRRPHNLLYVEISAADLPALAQI